MIEGDLKIKQTNLTLNTYLEEDFFLCDKAKEVIIDQIVTAFKNPKINKISFSKTNKSQLLIKTSKGKRIIIE